MVNDFLKILLFFSPVSLSPSLLHSYFFPQPLRDLMKLFVMSNIYFPALCVSYLAIYNRDQCCDLREIAYIIIESLQS